MLGLGAATALSLASSACRGPSQDAARRSRAPIRTAPRRSTVTPAHPGPAFAGHPSPGHLYYGASLPSHRSLSAWERTLGQPLALNRSYFSPERNEATALAAQCNDDLSNGRLPHVSSKAPGTWHEVATGAYDDWLTGILASLHTEGRPVFLTLHHEPENDAGGPGMLPWDFVAMQRHTIDLAADLAPDVTVVPVLQHWTFDPLHVDGNPRAWIVPGAAVLGVDIYNAWSPTNGKPWRSFGSRADEVVGWFGDTPIAIGEYGCREDPQNPGAVGIWLRDAAEYARTHNVVSLSYFNSGVNAPDGTLEIRGEAEATFAELLGSDWVVRPV